MERERQKCLAAGMNDHVPKPIEPDRLLATLLVWIDPKRLGTATSAPPAPSPRVEGLPELPGVEVASALSRVSGNVSLLRNLLKEFHDSWADVSSRVRHALEKADRDEALHLAHSLKGLSATLSMKGVSRAAEQLEKHLKQNDLNGAAENLDELDEAMSVVLPGLHELISETGQAPSIPTLPHDDEASATVAQTLAELGELLQDNDFEAADKLAVLQRLLPGSGPWSEALEALRSDIDRLDFDAAKQSLVGLSHVLAQPASEEL